MIENHLTADLTVAEVQALWPQTVAVFRDYATACVGCDLAAFCTITEAAQEHKIEVERLLAELQAIVEP